MPCVLPGGYLLGWCPLLEHEKSVGNHQLLAWHKGNIEGETHHAELEMLYSKWYPGGGMSRMADTLLGSGLMPLLSTTWPRNVNFTELWEKCTPPSSAFCTVP